MQSNGYIVGFAAAICVICALLLSGVSSALKEKQEANRVIDRQKNILVALGWSKDDVSALDAAGVGTKYKAGVQELVINSATGAVVAGKAIASLEVAVQKGEARSAKEQALYKRIGGQEAYALPFTGKGLWSTLYGYLALKPDGDEVVGVTYYKHGETPGLGAEIEATWFLDSFKGKKLYKNGKFKGIRVAKGKAKDQSDFKVNAAHMVDGMSGATLTGNGVTKMMTTGPRPYRAFFAALKTAPAVAPKPIPVAPAPDVAATADAGVALSSDAGVEVKTDTPPKGDTTPATKKDAAVKSQSGKTTTTADKKPAAAVPVKTPSSAAPAAPLSVPGKQPVKLKAVKAVPAMKLKVRKAPLKAPTKAAPAAAGATP